MVNQEKMKELDSHWKEVMALAQQYGFIAHACGGTAILLTHKNQLEGDGEETYVHRQHSMFGIEMGSCVFDDFGESLTSNKITSDSYDSEIGGQITIEEWLANRVEEG